MFIDLMRVNWESGDADEDVVVKLTESIDGRTVGSGGLQVNRLKQTEMTIIQTGRRGRRRGRNGLNSGSGRHRQPSRGPPFADHWRPLAGLAASWNEGQQSVYSLHHQ